MFSLVFLQKDFLSIDLVDGRVRVTVDLGSGPLALITDRRYNNGTWYKIAFQRNKKQGKCEDRWTKCPGRNGNLSKVSSLCFFFSFLSLLEWHSIQKPLFSLEFWAPGFTAWWKNSLFVVSQMHWASLVARLVKNSSAMQETPVRFLVWEDPLEKGYATHSNILQGFPGGWKRIALQCRRPGFNPWVGKIPWRWERLSIPVFWPGEFHGLYSPWSCKESDTNERLSLLQMHYLTLKAKLESRVKLIPFSFTYSGDI